MTSSHRSLLLQDMAAPAAGPSQRRSRPRPRRCRTPTDVRGRALVSRVTPYPPFGVHLPRLAAAAALGFLTARGFGRVDAVASAFHGRLQLIRRGHPLVVLHRGFAASERHFNVIDSLDCLQRVRHVAGAATASHTCYFQMFGLHAHVSF